MDRVGTLNVKGVDRKSRRRGYVTQEEYIVNDFRAVKITVPVRDFVGKIRMEVEQQWQIQNVSVLYPPWNPVLFRWVGLKKIGNSARSTSVQSVQSTTIKRLDSWSESSRKKSRDEILGSGIQG
jgi:hypothetical protein